MPATSTALLCARQVAALATDAWATIAQLPPFQVALAPAVSPETGDEAMPAAYAIPVAHSFDRAARKVIQHDAEIALLLVMELSGSDLELAAEDLLGHLEAAAKAVLDAGSSNGVKFINATAAEIAEPALLAQSGIFRGQVNITCSVLESRP